MLTRHNAVVGGAKSSVLSSTSAMSIAKRSWVFFQWANFHGWSLPYGGSQTNVTKEEVQNFRYFNTRPRDKWDYNRIDEQINVSSEFRDTSQRPTFETGQRQDNSFVNDGDTHTPGKYRLYEYFDEYTKPGTNKKVAACYAVKEQWDSDEMYYPGESWQQNRPGFRSVPKEILNRDTWYHWSESMTKFGEYQATCRTRSWNPAWPPAGYKMPKLQCKKEFAFGAEEPAILSEVERYYWFRCHADNNLRTGPRELLTVLVAFAIMYYYARSANDIAVWRSMYSNMFYPGRNVLRSWGTPKDWESDCFWWQRPLEEFPNQGEIYHMTGMRFAWMRYLQKRDEREKAEAQL